VTDLQTDIVKLISAFLKLIVVNAPQKTISDDNQAENGMSENNNLIFCQTLTKSFRRRCNIWPISNKDVTLPLNLGVHVYSRGIIVLFLSSNIVLFIKQ
jgi:hypothetical protein